MPSSQSSFPSPREVLLELRRWLIVHMPPDESDDLDGVDNTPGPGAVAPPLDDDMLADMDDVTLPITDLTIRQLLIYDISLRQKQQDTLDRLDKYMASLAESVEQLQAAVDDVAVRFATQVVPLQEALAEARAQIAAMELEDVEQQEALDAALSQADDAVAQIQAEIQELNSLGAEPDKPVEPVDPGSGPTGPTGPDQPDQPDAGATGPTGPDQGATGPTGPDVHPPAPDQEQPPTQP